MCPPPLTNAHIASTQSDSSKIFFVGNFIHLTVVDLAELIGTKTKPDGCGAI